MKCFVIMPYARDFDDVYHAIKRAGVNAGKIDCVRLDEERPAGRILGRLLDAIPKADLCIADLSSRNPNVMWELGYAMAHNKHPILITRDNDPLPFDLFDVHKIVYNRERLVETLERPLETSIKDSAEWLQASVGQNTEVEKLRGDVKRLYRLVAIGASGPSMWNAVAPESAPVGAAAGGEPESAVTGAWVERITGSRVHARFVRGELVAPYCFEGNNQLSGLYFDWRRRDDLVFARYAWRHRAVTGVSILKVEHPGFLVGNWWNSEASTTLAGEPDPIQESLRAEWVRAEQQSTPQWAEECFREIETVGVEALLKRWHSPAS